MPKITQFQCDCGCGTIKQDNTHWWMVYISGEGAWTICEWREDYQDREGIMYAAGQQCVHTMLDQFMSSQGQVEKEPS